MSASQFHDALPAGAQLLWYEIIKVLGKGGFGITYLGKDTNLDQLVAIKEYLPAGFATRDQGKQVRPNSPSDQETFQWGLDRFLQEAQILAKFKHPSIVKVLSFFRDSETNTAYMVMEFEEGESLDQLLKTKKALAEQDVIRLLPTLLEGLELLHQSGVIHRDIKPPNIFIRQDGSPVLLDFGAARQAIAGQGQQLTSLLSLGYSPFEQYDSSGGRQGPWSDIYAMGGVLYRAVTGQKPVDAAMRIAAKVRNDPDPMIPASELRKGRCSPGFLRAIDKALEIMETDRPQSIAAWRPMLLSGSAMASYAQSVPDPNATQLATQLGAPPPGAIGQDATIMAPEEGLARQQPSAPGAAASPPQAAARPAAPAGAKPPVRRRAKTTKKKSTWRSFISSLNDFGTQIAPKAVVAAVTSTPVPASRRPAQPAEELSPQPGQHAAMQQHPVTGLAGFPSAGGTGGGPSSSDTILTQHRPRKAGDIWVEPMTQMAFMWIPGGTFWMGSPKTESGRRNDEGPRHEIYVDGFWMAKYPVTWAQWHRVVGSPGKMRFNPAKGNYPVERVLWEDTQNFLRRFVRLIGSRFKLRLPTEAEWEYAARAGSSSAYFFGDNPEQLREYAWYLENSGGETQPVGRLKPNPWGLFDIMGNVWEWTDDWYGEDYYTKTPARNPRGAPFGEIRVRRGGSWRSHVHACRVAHRNQVAVQSNSSALGFRLVRVEQQQRATAPEEDASKG